MFIKKTTLTLLISIFASLSLAEPAPDKTEWVTVPVEKQANNFEFSEYNYQTYYPRSRRGIQPKSEQRNPKLIKAIDLFNKGEYAAALKINETEALRGSDKAKANLALAYREGAGVKKDLNRSFELMEDAAKSEDPLILYRLGQWYFYGENGVITYSSPDMKHKNRPQPTDRDRGLTLFEKSAKQGYVDAMLELGDIYGLGITVPLDKKRAMEWYDQAARKKKQ